MTNCTLSAPHKKITEHDATGKPNTQYAKIVLTGDGIEIERDISERQLREIVRVIFADY